LDLTGDEVAEMVSQNVIHGLSQFKVVFDAIRQLMAPPPPAPKPEIGFHLKEDAVPYRVRRQARR
jgi:hypothetical protein